MPGIVGIIKKVPYEKGTNDLELMVKCMMHEKFYTSGTYFIEQMGILLGWVSHQHSFSDCLPIWNEKKDICLIFTGEVIIDKKDLDYLTAHGHSCKSMNASYIVHLYEEIGIEFLPKLNGVFSGILVDFRENKSIIFNDRYGLSRIYYYENEDGFYVSSEAKSLLKILPKLRQLDLSSLGEFFALGCVLENRTLFSGISFLPAGSMWTFSFGRRVGEATYFNIKEWENKSLLNEADYYEKLKETLVRILPKYFYGMQRIAVSLTGGIDTRMIMAWASLPPFKIPCYTFGSIYRDSADVKLARKIAKKCQQRHETIRVNRKFFSEFPALAKRAVYYTDGTMDVSGSIELFVNRIAKEIAPIRITGNYGDQILRGAIGFKSKPLCEKIFNPDFMYYIRNGIKTYNNNYQNHPISFFISKQLPWCYYSRFALEQTQLTMRSPFIDNDLVSVAYQASPNLISSNELSLRLIAEGDPVLSRIATDRGILHHFIPVLKSIRHTYAELTFKAEYAYDYGMPHWLVRIDNYFTPLHLEKIFLGRHKFYHFRIWYRNELSRYVQDILLDMRTRTRSYFNGTIIESMVKDHIAGQANYTVEIHRAITSELVQRYLIEQI